ncbi:MAG: lipase maturation factor family protein [Chloroflexota bacterium]|nr:lipase maturation factor family protein [Chloroflexota bacterium]MDQ5867984.1 lipase maturation factor family protein [Chloroflexota bacterium]
MGEGSPAAVRSEEQEPGGPGTSLAGRVWRALSGPPGKREYTLTRWLFLRGLGVVYLVAFASLWEQVLGLIGRNGILPAKDFLYAVEASGARDPFWLVPTLGWLNSSDDFLLFLCWGGMLLSGLLILGVLPGPVLALLWAFYLSLVSLGQDFLSFQWDALLLETGFLAIFFAPLQLWWGVPREVPPSRAVLWLLRLLLFRLMFFSGVVKLVSGDPTWHGLTALDFHYWTQPLPNPLAWYMHQLPTQFHQLSTALTLAIELGAPFLIFGPRRVRLLGAALLAGLQVVIMLTGNFAFFNILSIVLCVPLLDDGMIARFLPESVRARVGEPVRRRPLWLLPRRLVTVPLVALILTLTWVQVQSIYFTRTNVPDPLYDFAVKLLPFQVVNSYGLFAVMTTTRPEIVVEGSADGRTWVEYEFKYKPGHLNRIPPMVAPYQPRLDWQMWFAALSGPVYDPMSSNWFRLFMRRLLQGSPEVVSLLRENPFPDRPPRFVRAQVYRYTFTGFGESGWWRRELRGDYFPVSTLQSLRQEWEILP